MNTEREQAIAQWAWESMELMCARPSLFGPPIAVECQFSQAAEFWLLSKGADPKRVAIDHRNAFHLYVIGALPGTGISSSLSGRYRETEHPLVTSHRSGKSCPSFSEVLRGWMLKLPELLSRLALPGVEQGASEVSSPTTASRATRTRLTTRHALLSLLDAYDFLSLQLSEAKGVISAEQLETEAAKHLCRIPWTDTQLLAEVQVLARLIPERLDAELVSLIFHCGLDQAVRVLNASAFLAVQAESNSSKRPMVP